jgi:non-specific serine/threonine protein kinase
VFALADTERQKYPDSLPIGSELGDFTITDVIGAGGFGMVYVAHDASLDRTVAIKEYLPVNIAGRADVYTVLVRSHTQQDAFNEGLQNFLREARLQARFSHPAMLEVYRVWEQNGTAYMAMRYYPGSSLRALRLDPASADMFDEAAIRQITLPVFDALRVLHAESVLHRDVAPDNILMLPSGAPVLLDFGAARSVVAGATQSFTTVLKPGYAPIEQYADDGAMEQGPWTDVYALGAVLHFLAVGSPPSQAVTRMMGGTLKSFEDAAAGRFSDVFITAVKAALEVRGHERLQSVAAFKEALGWGLSDGDERPVSRLVTGHTFPSQLPNTAAKTAKAVRTAAAAKTTSTKTATAPSAATISVAPSKTAPTEKKQTQPPTVASEIAAPAEPPKPSDETVVLPRAKTQRTTPNLKTPAPLPASKVKAAPTPAKSAPNAAPKAREASARVDKVAALPHARRPRHINAVVITVFTLVVGAIAAIAVLRGPSAPPATATPAAVPTTPPQTTPQLPPAAPPALTAEPSSVTPQPAAASIPSVSPSTPPISPTSSQATLPEAPKMVRNTLDLKDAPSKNSAQRSVETAPARPSSAAAADSAAAAAAAEQAQRASVIRAEKRAATKLASSNETQPASTAETYAKPASDGANRADICGRILAKLSLGSAELSDGEKNQLRACK